MSFQFKQFFVKDTQCAMKVGTDGVLLGCFIAQELSTENLKTPAYKALDIGTGSGLISLMVAQQLPNIQILAIDIDSQAAQQAAENFANSPWANQLIAQHNSLQEFIRTSIQPQNFNIIFSNPPFFENSLKNPNAQRTIARHNDTLPIDYLFHTATDLLAENGHFFIILPYNQPLPATPNLHLITQLDVKGHAHKPFKRKLLHYINSIHTKPSTPHTHHTTLILQDEHNQRTPEYQAFAQPYYL